MPNNKAEEKVIEKKKKTNEVASKSSNTKAKSNKNNSKRSAKSATATTKASKSSKSSTTVKKNNKKIADKKVAETKKSAKKAKLNKKVENKNIAKKDEKINEQTVIEKIKAFIAKIVAMQEEALEEEESKKEEKESKSAKLKDKKEITAKPSYILEYYDLPYRYNETVVKILAQTPKRLFVYWDISDKDRQKYLLAFGEKFFEETYPVLLVHNEDMNYTFEVPINDFANSWYLDINDSKSKYTIELGRKFKTKPEIVNIVAATETESVVLHNDYVPIITSNMLEVPNDHILFENIQSKVLYRNVKNGEESTVNVDNLEFANKIGHIYSIYDVYKEIYKNELNEGSLNDLLNPSSMSSSTFNKQ